MADRQDLALQFMSRWGESFASLRSSIAEYFTLDTVWENVGLTKTIGVDGALALVDFYRHRHGLATIKVDLVNILGSGEIVMTERVDRLLRDDGSDIHTVRLMGIFKFAGSQLLAQRDYSFAPGGHDIGVSRANSQGVEPSIGNVGP